VIEHETPAEGPDLPAVWQRVLSALDAAGLTPAERAWLRLTQPLGIMEGTLLLAAPNDFTKTLIDDRLRDSLREVFASELGPDMRVAVTVRPAEPDERADDREGGAARDSFGPVMERRGQHVPGTGRGAARSAEPARLNPKYQFETFVIGASNRFPHAAAVAVAEAPAKAYNPLFIYGDSGLGKTHLLHAIGHYAHALFPTSRAVM